MPLSTRWMLSPAHRLRSLPDHCVEVLDTDHESTIYTDPTASVLLSLVEGAPSPRSRTTRRVLRRLSRSGLALRLPAGLAPSVARRWLRLGVPLEQARRAIDTPLALHEATPRCSSLNTAFLALGLRVADSPSRSTLTVLAAPDLALTLRSALPSPGPTVAIQTARVSPFEVWLEPGRTACLACLRAHLLRSDRTADLAEAALPAPVLSPDAIAERVAIGLATRAWDVPHALLQPLPSVPTPPTRPCLVQRRPACPACGRAGAPPRPPVLVPRPKGPGSHRWRPLAWARSLASDLQHAIGGVVRDLPTGSRTLPPEAYAPLHVRRVRHAAPLARTSLTAIRATTGLTAGGSGGSPSEATVAAVFEGIERASGFFPGADGFRFAHAGALGEDAVVPNAVLQFSDAQFETRDAWNRTAHPFLRVPERFDPARPTHWVQAWSLAEPGAFRWVPCGLAFYAYPFADQPTYAYADSNGCASGSCLEEAALYGAVELVERDSVALWHRSRSQRPALDAASIDSPLAQSLLAATRRRGRVVEVLDVSTEIGLATFVAVSVRPDAPHGIALGFGAHLSPRTAAEKALQEMHLMAVETDHPDGPGSAFDWAETVCLDDHPFLLPHPGLPRIDLGALPDLTTGDLRDDLDAVVARLAAAGLSAYLIAQTHPHVGVPTARVVVPGLVHFWRRLGGARIRDVAAATGWQTCSSAWEAADALELTT